MVNGELRCQNCSKLLAKGDSFLSSIEVKCHRCGHLNSLFDKNGDMVIVTNPDGIILYANPQVETITGYTIDQVVGQRPSLWGQQMGEEFYKNLWKAIKIDKRAVAMTIANKRKDGQPYQAHVRISPILDAGGEVRFFVGIATVVSTEHSYV